VGQGYHVAMKNESLPKEPLARPQVSFMTCDLGRRVSGTPWWKASVSSVWEFDHVT
jgi:hypothetical protein